MRLGDVDPQGRLRLDALTRYTQDVSDDDTTDAGLAPEPGWVVRSTVVDELAPAQLAEGLRFETFCSGLGGRWAERRLSIVGESGGRYEVATLWVCVDAGSGRPHRLTDQFRAIYGEAAGDRRISARQLNPGPPPPDRWDEVKQWQVRLADLDVYGHVNNAAYWAAVEQWAEPWAGPRRARMEYGGGVSGVDEIDILVDRTDRSVGAGRTGGAGRAVGLWWLGPRVEPEPEGAAGGEAGGAAREAVASAWVVDLAGRRAASTG